ncbi:energy-coupling factor ABC transporter ATP-binding protein [Desulfurobacterium indicum]|uniref:Energy-coupling factor ABC transporter ATP-binding protein n=1 Tax=Desulfurobacterium indicum TaxID=1914305 RepID=A0A1R1MJ66_9BACT|nr:ABC transporter ATP-binding protein [Desulfurobacterium indicum]OMH39848.1 energy-coupling factor ABC transporter ATP-binding protein [Desulfurobacterium indicum]
MEILKVENLTVKRNGKIIFKNINLNLRKKEKFFIIGPNGAGKTTLIETIIGFIKPDTGRIFLKGKEVKTEDDFYNLRTTVGYIFQNPDDQLFSPTVEEDIAFGPLNLGISRTEIPKIIDNVLSTLGIFHLKNKMTYKLSGGEKRLVSIASVLSMNPEALIMDEPTVGVDNEKMKLLIKFLKTTDKSIIMITHNKEVVEELGWPMYKLENGYLNYIE